MRESDEETEIGLTYDDFLNFAYSFPKEYALQEVPDYEYEFNFDELICIHEEFEDLKEKLDSMSLVFACSLSFKCPALDLMNKELKGIDSMFAFLIDKVSAEESFNKVDVLLIKYLHEFVLNTQEELGIDPA